MLLEAMASGCAIVTTRVGEICTILDESNACLVDEPTADSLAEVLGRMIGDAAVRRKLGLRAHARFVVRFCVSRHLDLWEDLLSRKTGGEAAKA